MKNACRVTTWFLATTILSCAIPAVADEYYLYKPEAVETPQSPPSPADGVLVKKIIIRRGDTLSALSGEYGEKRSYYPQILLFNNIKNPNRIYAGNSLLVPLKRIAKQHTLTGRGSLHRKRAAVGSFSTAPAQVESPKAAEPQRSMGELEQSLYANAVKVFEKGEYRKALDEFTGFLAKYPDSPRAADAMLYRAECYARLSGR